MAPSGLGRLVHSAYISSGLGGLNPHLFTRHMEGVRGGLELVMGEQGGEHWNTTQTTASCQ